MKKLTKLASLIITAAVVLCGCAPDGEETVTELTDGTSGAQPDITDISGESQQSSQTSEPEPSDETTTTPLEEGFTDIPDIAEPTDTPASVTQPPEITTETPAASVTTSGTGNGAPELTPDADSGETYTVNIAISDISRIKYTSQQIAENDVFAPVTVTLTNAAFKNEIGAAFNGLLFVSVSSADKNAENNAIASWRDSNPAKSAQAETLVFLDKNGRELIRFTTELSSALTAGGDSSPLTRATVNGTDYDLFYGEFDYNEIKYTLLNQTLVSKGFFTLETFAAIAKTAVSGTIDDFESASPDYRVYSPDSTVVLRDGTVKYPADFADGTLLVDCIFAFPGTAREIVTMNAADGSVLQTKILA